MTSEPKNNFKIEFLRVNDRLEYQGKQWDVTDYKTYTDKQGYKTEDWLLKEYKGNEEYYLMREFDPQKEKTSVTWYMGKEIPEPQLCMPGDRLSITHYLWQDMKEEKSSYPRLQLFDSIYELESETRGFAAQEGEAQERVTRDYWDERHENNLALEAYNDGSLYVYLSRVADKNEFSFLGNFPCKPKIFSLRKFLELLGASLMILIGLILFWI
jgi:hypothetical protein